MLNTGVESLLYGRQLLQALLATTEFFIAGLLLLLSVNENRGRAAALHPD